MYGLTIPQGDGAPGGCLQITGMCVMIQTTKSGLLQTKPCTDPRSGNATSAAFPGVRLPNKPRRFIENE